MTTRIEAAVKAWDHYWGDRYGDEALEEMGDEVKVALDAADSHDAAHGIHRVSLDDATVERAAEAAALVDDYDGCFERVREWESREEWEREAHPESYPGSDYEDREWWIKRTRAVLAAAVEADGE